MKTQYLLAVMFFFYSNLYGQSNSYLKVSRSATLKEFGTSDGRILEKVKTGEYLFLVNPEQNENGYYLAQNQRTGVKGWIYRSLVRRYKGLPPGFSQDFNIAGLNELRVHVVDVGGGLCNIIELPDNRYILYDAGHYTGYGESSFRQIQEIIPKGSTIELMILSHTDADHIGAAGHVIRNYKVKTLLRTGYEKSTITPSESDRPTATYRRLISALNEVNYSMEDINLNQLDSVITPGVTRQFGKVTVRFLCGFGSPLNEWGALDQGEKINSVSIVMKLEYQGKSILFCGDAVGRHLKDNDPNALIATESFLISHASNWLKSDVIIAPHHGAKNGSSTAFVDAVRPAKVVFSAGHAHKHPTQNTAEQYLRYIRPDDIFRTDYGDDESEPNKPDYEWTVGRISGCVDSYGDDDVLISIDSEGSLFINYKGESADCVGE